MKSTLHNQDSVQISISKFVVLKLQKIEYDIFS